MKVVAFGSGNVANHLLPYLISKGFELVQIYGRNKKSTNRLAKKIKSKAVFSLDQIDTKADLYLLMITDDAIAPFAKKLSKQIPLSSLVCHTSGSVSSDVLQPFKHIGVIYPLQTFSTNEKLDIAQVPFFYSSSNRTTKKKIQKIAEIISDKAVFIKDSDRKNLHLSAVFSNNFVNHLLLHAKEIAEESKIDFEYLHPLIRETIRKALFSDPGKTQTGPAKRNDKNVLRNHIRMLEGDEAKRKIYRLLSKSITNRYK